LPAWIAGCRGHCHRGGLAGRSTTRGRCCLMWRPRSRSVATVWPISPRFARRRPCSGRWHRIRPQGLLGRRRDRGQGGVPGVEGLPGREPGRGPAGGQRGTVPAGDLLSQQRLEHLGGLPAPWSGCTAGRTWWSADRRGPGRPSCSKRSANTPSNKACGSPGSPWRTSGCCCAGTAPTPSPRPSPTGSWSGRRCCWRRWRCSTACWRHSNWFAVRETRNWTTTPPGPGPASGIRPVRTARSPRAPRPGPVSASPAPASPAPASPAPTRRGRHPDRGHRGLR
jgi:hypothetical protein